MFHEDLQVNAAGFFIIDIALIFAVTYPILVFYLLYCLYFLDNIGSEYLCGYNIAVFVFREPQSKE